MFNVHKVNVDQIMSLTFDLGDEPRDTFGVITYRDVNPFDKRDRGLYVILRHGEDVVLVDCFKSRYFPHFWIDKPTAERLNLLEGRGDVYVGNRRYGFAQNDGSVGVAEGRVLGSVVRINVWKPFYVPVVRDYLRSQGALTFESRIPFVARFMIDLGLRPYTTRIAYWDVEADVKAFEKGISREAMKSARILSISVCDSKGNCRVFADSDEKRLLERFMQYIRKYDVMVGYNSGYVIPNHRDFMNEQRVPGFDLPLLWWRLQQVGLIELADMLSFWEWYDIYPVVHKMTKGYVSTSLGAVLERVLGLSKYASGAEIGKMDLEELVAYNKIDAYNTMYLDHELGIVRGWLLKRAVGFLPSLSECSKHLVLEGNNRPLTYLVMWYSVNVAPKLGKPIVRLLDNDLPRNEGTIEGGYVFDPVPGVWHRVAVLDFAGTYPSIIQEEHIGIDPTGNGAYPYLARALVQLRKKYKKLMKETFDPAKKSLYDAMQLTFKIFANAMYGILGYVTTDKGNKKTVYSYLYSVELANKITAAARNALISISERLRNDGYMVLYGDTDSMMVHKPDWAGIPLRKVVKEAEGLRDYVNQLLEGMGFKVLRVKLEKIFDPLVFFAGGQKKRYFGRVVWEDGEVWEWVFKGMELVRSDTPAYIRPYLMMVVDLLDSGVPYDEALDVALSTLLNDLYAGKLNDKLVQSKRLSKPVEAYKSKADHVQAAIKAKEKYGYEYKVGDRVFYVKTLSGWEPLIPGRSMKGLAIDYGYYAERAKNTFMRLRVSRGSERVSSSRGSGLLAFS